ncbi:MAG: class I SAM-dependent methyltransferase [Terrimicrobiaceae bacterium]
MIPPDKILQHLYAARIIGFGPLRIPTHMSYRERISLFRTARLLAKGSSIVEIGSWIGASISVMAAATENFATPLICIDTWMNEGMCEDPSSNFQDRKAPHMGEKLSTFEEFQKNTARLAGRLTTIRMDSAKLSSRDLPKNIGIFFIDGDHSYHACKSDLDLALSVASKDTQILCHDFGIHRGVTDAICEYHAAKKVVLHKLVDSLAHLVAHP